jgi:hypothetical protein
MMQCSWVYVLDTLSLVVYVQLLQAPTKHDLLL